MASVSNLAIKLQQRGADKGFEKATVQLRYLYKRKPHYISTGIRVEVALWDFKTDRLKINRKAGNDASSNQLTKATNDHLEAFMLRAKRIMLDAESEGQEPTPQYLKDKLKRLATPTPAGEHTQMLLLDTWQVFIDHCRDALKVSPATQKAYVHARNHVMAFSKATKHKLTFETLTPQVADQIVTYLKNRNLTNTTCGGVIKNLKVFC